MNLAVVTATRGRRPDLLKRAVESVKEQDWEGRIDHYVVSDGAGELEIPEGPELLVREERGGPGAARNTALKRVSDGTYEYVWCLDDDDWATNTFLNDLYTVIEDNDVAYGDLTIYNLEKQDDEWVHKDGGPQFSKDWGGWGSMKEQPYIPLPACLFKQSYFKEYGLFREDIGRCVDWELLARGEAEGAQFIHLKKIVGFAEWRWGEGTDNISTVQPEANFPPTSWSRIKTLISGHYI